MGLVLLAILVAPLPVLLALTSWGILASSRPVGAHIEARRFAPRAEDAALTVAITALADRRADRAWQPVARSKGL